MSILKKPVLETAHRTGWTPNIVEERLVEAAHVLACLPSLHVQDFYVKLPFLAPSADDLAYQPRPSIPAAPVPAAIDRIEQIVGWFKWLKPDDAKLAWARARRMPWKPICWHLGISRATAHRRYLYALSVIAWRLNGRQIPKKRSRQFLIECLHRVSSRL